MSDKCRRYVADPNIECFRASRCDAIVYREKIFRLYRCRCNGVVRKILNLSVIYRLVWFAYYIRDLTLDGAVGGLNRLFYAQMRRTTAAAAETGFILFKIVVQNRQS